MNSEEAYRRWRAGESKAKIARDAGIRRGTIGDWVEKELRLREKAYSLVMTMKNILR